jgi:hypothetical protein
LKKYSDYYINGVHWFNKGSDYFIGQIPLSIEKNKSLSLAVWKVMCQATPEQLQAIYVPNESRKHEKKTGPSFLVTYLRDHSWIPSKDGKFYNPCDMTTDLLLTEFLYDDRNGWLASVNFGVNAVWQSKEYQEKSKIIKDMGFDNLEEAQEYARISKEAKLNPTILRSILEQHKNIEQPENTVPNPERRRRGVLERQENAPPKESVARERSIQPGLDKRSAEAKAYLRPNYTNPNQQLVCQCCRKEMPFKVGDDYYFEAVQCVRGLEQHYVENRLALCPTCAAMYKHARQTEDEDIIRRLVEHEASDDAPSIEIAVKLAGKDYQLRFVGKHWFDIKTVFENLRMAKESDD